MVIGATRGLVLQVLLALNSFTETNCVVICAKGTRFLRFSRLISAYREIEFSGQDDDRFVDHVNRFAENMPDLVLIPTDCDGARMTSRLRSRLKATIFPCPDVSMLDRLDNKWHFYQFCRQHGLMTPQTRFIGEKDKLDFAATALELGSPFVVKPVDQAGSKGVQAIASEEDYHRKILHNDSYQHHPLIAQRYIRGTDVGLNLLSVKGKVAAIAIQQRQPPQHEAAEIRFTSNDYLVSAAHILAGAIAYEGVMNVDARIEDGTGTVFLFECNPRFWRSLLASVWCGLNFVGEALEPRAQPEHPRMLTSGSADTFWHPVFRPPLWRYALFDRSHRGRMVRAMMYDICFLGSSIAFKANASAGRPPPAISPAPRNAAI